MAAKRRGCNHFATNLVSLGCSALFALADPAITALAELAGDVELASRLRHAALESRTDDLLLTE
jgi:hypothetical protein